MKIHIRIFVLGLLGLILSQSSYAEIGRIETKRERMKREQREAPGKSTQDAYLKIHENFLRENYTEVDRLADSYLSDGNAKANSEDVLYLQALSLLKLNRGDEARSKFKTLETSFSSSSRKAGVSASIADSYYYEGNLSRAYEAYQETLNKYPNSDQTVYASYKQNELAAKLGKSQEVNRSNSRISNGSFGGTQSNHSAKQFSIMPGPVSASAGPLKQLSFEEVPYFAVQVGSFAKARNATAFMNKLIHRRYSAYIDRDAKSGLYRVRVGHLAGKAEANALESRLKRDGYPTKIYP